MPKFYDIQCGICDKIIGHAFKIEATNVAILCADCKESYSEDREYQDPQD